ncbi:hypothetical protein ES319_A09G065200v1 [Gossypium barbadense]|uniref:Uncharacterized protein n=2 Tax=Gossypium TaxID=3633 RepID=A0A5J5UB20_GOSBA|nr:hypothetical protein ES319_A09G065200v1 [Gossypium barbadense]TYH01706.1 hypothetical protein ES288_A09G081500v1 [Gossypium darwinii]
MGNWWKDPIASSSLSWDLVMRKGLSFYWMHGPGLAEFMHSDDLFELTADLKVCILSLFCSICILLDFWCSMISDVFCLIVIDKLSVWWDIYLYHRYYSCSQYFDNEF